MLAHKIGVRCSLCINAGFDKVYVSSVFLDNPEIVRKIADIIGSQSLGIVLPYLRMDMDEEARVWDYRTKTPTEYLIRAALEDSINIGLVKFYFTIFLAMVLSLVLIP